MQNDGARREARRPDTGQFDAVDAGAAAATQVNEPVEGAPSDNTSLVNVIRAFEDRGFTAQFITGQDAMVTCASGDETVPAADLLVEASRRLEGASDPDDMMTVIALRCPQCGAAGTLVLGYGPNATEEDAAVHRALGEQHTARSDDTGERVDPEAPGSSLFLGGDDVEPNEPA
jgi:hypothetical protein